MNRPFLVFCLSAFWVALVVVAAANDGDEGDYNNNLYCTGEATPLKAQTPNTFFKVCPEKHQFRTLGQPICGDGTPFSFYVTRPLQKHDYSKRILIEFVGGGACWDAETCDKQADYLTAPSEKFDAFVGKSCSEAAVGVGDGDGKAINLLCATQLGATDLSAYTTFVVPYCTQDCHAGDSTMSYADNDGGDGDGNNYNEVHHAGAHNMMSVMRYIYDNFDRPSHIVLTGCSAGGTALPLAYHLLHRHYTHFGVRSTQISVLADSPVFLTPTYFLQNAFENWNTRSLIGKDIGFGFNKWKNDEQYPVKLWEYILRRGSNRDKWGFISHYDDPTSQAYYQWMSGGNDNQERRFLENNNDDDVVAQWYEELTGAMKSVQARHSNVDTYWYGDESAHCSFGLYYPLQSDGFSDWAGKIVKEQRLQANPQPAPFFLSVASSILLMGAALYYSRRHSRNAATLDGEEGDFIKYEEDDALAKTDSWNHSFQAGLASVAAFVCKHPVTHGYMIAITTMFCIMVTREGFVHPLNNPSLGPSAIALSEYGINNPSLIVYRFHIWRLFTSCFMCSGALTYIIIMLGLWFSIRSTEEITGSRFFGIAAFVIAAGSNLFYAVTCHGASCSALALLLGLFAFTIGIRTRLGAGKWLLFVSTVLTLIIASLFFPFNSWVLMLTAILIGACASSFLFKLDPDLNVQIGTDQVFHIKRKRFVTFLMACGGLLTLLIIRIARPSKLYLEPFYTGCNLQYANDIGNIASNFYDNGGDRRSLEGDENDNNEYCAQFCVPHLVSRGVRIGARKTFDFEITDGTCAEIGYEYHVADKTFKYFSYSLDVEVYQSADDGDDGGN